MSCNAYAQALDKSRTIFILCELVRSDRAKTARSRFHLLDHKEHLAECPGCQAKAKNNPRYAGAFERSVESHSQTITMNQVAMTDVDGTQGIGGYRYAIVLAEVEHGYWTFKPLKGLGSDEAKKVL